MDAHRKKKTRSAAATLRRMLLILPVLAVAVVCYAVSVFAWFQAGVVNAGNTIRTGRYAAEVALLDKEGNVLWESGAIGSDYSGPIHLASGGADAAVLRITGSGTLAFQYQVRLTAEGGGEMLFQKADAAGKPLILQPGTLTDYPLDTAADGTALRLELHVAFQHGTLEPIPPPPTAAVPAVTAAVTTGTSLPAQPGTTAGEETAITTVRSSAPTTADSEISTTVTSAGEESGSAEFSQSTPPSAAGSTAASAPDATASTGENVEETTPTTDDETAPS